MVPFAGYQGEIEQQDLPIAETGPEVDVGCL